ncbi:hypothetical protein PFISCL1PPCAC_28336, partial [Pristionchus fissidentatus]
LEGNVRCPKGLRMCFIDTGKGFIEDMPVIKATYSDSFNESFYIFIERSLEVKVHEDFLSALSNTELCINPHVNDNKFCKPLTDFNDMMKTKSKNCTYPTTTTVDSSTSASFPTISSSFTIAPTSGEAESEATVSMSAVIGICCGFTALIIILTVACVILWCMLRKRNADAAKTPMSRSATDSLSRKSCQPSPSSKASSLYLSLERISEDKKETWENRRYKDRRNSQILQLSKKMKEDKKISPETGNETPKK